MNLKHTMLLLAGLAGAALFADDALLTENGLPKAEIVVDCEKASPCPVEFGAKELQLWIGKISGAKLPIVSAPSADSNVKIFIGTPDYSRIIKARAGKHSAELKKLAGGDGFLIERDGQNVYIIGSIPKGALNGVYWFLHDNTDIVFVRPAHSEDGYGTIFGQEKSLKLKQQSVTRVPAFPRYRYFEARTPDMHLWETRQMNRPNTVMSYFQDNIEEFTNYGVNFIDGRHSFNLVLPIEEFTAKHPEFYPLRDGKRFWNLSFDTFLCWTNKEALKTFTEYYLAMIGEGVAKGITQFDLPHGDVDQVCLCENCTKDVVDDGKVVAKFEDAEGFGSVPAHMANFNSTRYYLFMNEVAKAVAAKYPDVRLRGMAYWITRIAPGVKVEPNIDIVWCPYKKSIRLPLEDKRQTSDRYNYPKTFDEWTGAARGEFYLYEYYLCTQPAMAPNPVADVTAADLRYYLKHNMKAVYFDSNGWDWKQGIRDHGRTWERAFTFDASAIEMYAISQLMWDPSLDPEKLRDEFCERAYRDAAPEMREFYRLYHQGWDKDEEFLAWDAGPEECYRRYVVKPGNGPKAEALLKAAYEKAKHPGSKALIKRQLDLYMMAVTTKKGKKTY